MLKTQKTESLFPTLKDSGSVLDAQAQIGRNYFCCDLPKLRAFRKVEPVQGKHQGSLWVWSLHWAWRSRDALSVPSCHHMLASPAALHWGNLSLAPSFILSSLALWTTACLPPGRSELGHQLWDRHSDCISRINKTSLRGMTIIMHFLKYVTREEQKGNWDLILFHLSNVSKWLKFIFIKDVKMFPKM